jgi:NAD(P)-dependent dehydrogenase (short-subunit alcohol dehydrogenase family)
MVSGYGCAKAAMVRLTESLAVETRPYNIPIFALYPGIVRTRIMEEVAQSEAGQRWMPEARTALEERAVPPERAAQLVVYLAAGHGDGLSGRCLYEHYDVAALAQRAEAIQRHDLYVLRLREE